MPTTTTRGLVVPALTGDGSDLHEMFQDLADSIEAMMDSDVVLGAAAKVTDGLVVNGLEVPASGTGVEVGYTAGAGFVQAQQRGPSVAKPMVVGGSEVRLNAAGVQSGTATATGFDVVGDLTVSDDVTVTDDVAVGGDLAVTGTINGRSVLASHYFRAYRAAAVSLATGAVVVFDTDDPDPNGWLNTANGRFIPTVAGRYRLTWMVAFSGVLTADKYLLSECRKNGTRAAIGQSFVQRGAAGPTSPGSVQVTANGSTDFFDIVANHDNGGSVALSVGTPNTYFEAEYIGA